MAENNPSVSSSRDGHLKVALTGDPEMFVLI
jgi:hypothetical protein